MHGLKRITENLAAGPSIVWVLWAGLALVTVSLLVMMRTRFGRNHPLRKCVVLSLIVHGILCGYFWTVKIVGDGGTSENEPTFRIKAVRVEEEEAAPQPSGQMIWQKFASEQSAPETSDAPRDDEAWPTSPEERPLAEASLPPDVRPQRMVHSPAVATDMAALSAPDAATTNTTLDPAAPPAVAPPQNQSAPARELPGAAPPARREMTAPVSVEPRPAAPPAESLLPSPDTSPRTEASLASPLAEELSSGAAASAVASDVAPQDVVQQPAGTPLANVEPPHPQQATSNAGPSGLQKIGPTAGVAPPEREIPVASGAVVETPAREHVVPELYQLRTDEDRLAEVRRRGGSPDTEAAVQAALAWFAANQERDGRWDADRHGAGREQKTLGQNRHGAGARADTGVTALAVLAFLGAGHTHEQGEHQDTVRAALAYLIESQASSGDLAGEAEIYAAMYCHGMATLAMAEAYGMTGDAALRKPLERAIDFTLRSQLADGSWRYRPGDPRGDTSQLGWQLMALKSAEMSGIDVPPRTRDGVVRFLRSVASGRRGGLASYRAGEPASRTMTAEALFCRQLLGAPRGNPANDEAGEFVLGELPGDGDVNFYYWYYATLSMYQLQDEHWQRWNSAMQGELLAQQRKQGDLAGSFDPDPVWGAYGGRIYSTALATLCLEVYYRYLPMYSAMEQRTVR